MMQSLLQEVEGEAKSKTNCISHEADGPQHHDATVERHVKALPNPS